MLPPKILIFLYNSPRPDLFNVLLALYSLTNLSNIPLINILLFGVLYSLAISKYSLMVTLTGIEGKYKNSQIAILSKSASKSAILSVSQFGVFPSISCWIFSSFNTVFLNNKLANSLSSTSLNNAG